MSFQGIVISPDNTIDWQGFNGDELQATVEGWIENVHLVFRDTRWPFAKGAVMVVNEEARMHAVTPDDYNLVATLMAVKGGRSELAHGVLGTVVLHGLPDINGNPISASEDLMGLVTDAKEVANQVERTEVIKWLEEMVKELRI